MSSNLRIPSALSFEGDIAANFLKFKQRFMLYMMAAGHHEKAEEIKVAIFLNIIGEEGLEKFNTFDLSEEDENNLDKVIEEFEKICVPKVNESVERHIFFMRNQNVNESIDSYVTELKRLSATCKFGIMRDSLIRDKVISGIRDAGLKDKLLNTDNLDLEKCIQICKSMEITKTRLEKMGLESENTINVIQKIGKDDNRSEKKYQKNNQVKTGYRKFNRYTNDRKNERECQRCGIVHQYRACPAWGKECRKCGKLNHFMKYCKTQKIKYNQRRPNDTAKQGNINMLGNINDNKYKNEDWYETVIINNKSIKFKLDTGAKVNVLPLSVSSRLNVKKVKTWSQLRNYNGTKINVIGKCTELCLFKNGQKEYIEFEIVSECNEPPAVLGLHTIIKIGLLQRQEDIASISDHTASISNHKRVEMHNIVKEYYDLFNGVGKMDYEYDIKLKTGAVPCQEPTRHIAYNLMIPLKKELERLEKIGVVRKIIKPTEWINALTIVKKVNNSIRLCLDPQKLNKCIEREYYALPTFEDIVARMPGAKYFSVLDGQSGFWHIQLTERSQELTTFSTPYGRYCFMRLPFGLCSAPEVFVRCFRNIFENLEGVEIYVDDLIVWGHTEKEHDDRLIAVLNRAREKNVRFNKDKCKIKVQSVKFVGHELTHKGIQPDEDKVKAIKEMQQPKSKKELETYLGTVVYLTKFLPRLSQISKPLRELTHKDSIWVWTEKHTEAFKEINKLITEPTILQYYNKDKPIVVSVDASKDGLGAVLMQEGLPVAYASKALTKTQQAYAQIEKEALAMVYGCERFHQYIYGTHFTIETDHQPLETIFKKSLQQCPMRIQRMKIKLQQYDFEVKYKPGKLMFIPDMLSRAYLEEKEMELSDQEIELYIGLIQDAIPISTAQTERFRKETSLDTELQTVLRIIQTGWPEKRKDVPDIAKAYYTFKEELWELNGLLMKGEQIVVPTSLRSEMLNRIHYNHCGIEKCKHRAREHIYWPLMCNDIENLIKMCNTCVMFQRKQQKESLMPIEIPSGPWQVVGSDIYETDNMNYVIVVDYYSKFVEIEQLKDLNSETLIQKLKAIFSRHGIPERFISDNGTQYTSSTFKKFKEEWGFEHRTSSPHYAQSNGMSERYIQTAKNMLSKVLADNRDSYLALLEWRSTPLEHNLASPAELLYNRKLNHLLPRGVYRETEELKQIRTTLIARQAQQKKYFDRQTKSLQPLQPGDRIYMENYGHKQKPWMEGEVIEQNRPRSYAIRNHYGNIVHRNRRHLYKGNNKKPFVTRRPMYQQEDLVEKRTEVEKELIEQVQETENTQYTKSGRLVKKPAYLQDYVQ